MKQSPMNAEEIKTKIKTILKVVVLNLSSYLKLDPEIIFVALILFLLSLFAFGNFVVNFVALAFGVLKGYDALEGGAAAADNVSFALKYLMIFGCLTVVDDMIPIKLPLYATVKLMALLYIAMGNGTPVIYEKAVKPLLSTAMPRIHTLIRNLKTLFSDGKTNGKAKLY